MKSQYFRVLIVISALALSACTKEDDDPPPNAAPTVTVPTPTGVQSGDITITYTLSDAESDVCSIAAGYSVDGGANFSPATEGTGGDGTTGLTSSPTGVSHTFVWDSVADGVALTSLLFQTVQVRLTPADTAAGAASATASFSVCNILLTASSVSPVTPPMTQAGLVRIGYTLIDGASDVCTIAVEFSINGGGSFSPCTDGPGGDGTSGLTSSPSGESHMYVWNSLADGVAPAAPNTTVQVRVTPSDAQQGISSTSGNFTVDNASLTSGSPIGGMFYPIQYDPSGTGSGLHAAQGIATDGTYMYLVGTDGTNDEWNIQKRDLHNGSLVSAFDTDGIVTTNPSIGTDEDLSIAIDSTHMIVAGSQEISANNDAFRIEKRDLTTGALDTGFGTNGVVTTAGLGTVIGGDVAIDGTSFFLAGAHEVTPGGGDLQVRLEKRSLSDGSLVTAFGTGGVLTSNFNSNIDVAFRVLVTGTSIVVVGIRDINMTATSNGAAMIEKRDASTGALDTGFGTGGVVTSDTSTGNDFGLSVASDGTDLYVFILTETAQGSGTYTWRTEKRALADGSLSTSVTSASGANSYMWGSDLLVQGTSLYACRHEFAADPRWRVEKRALSDLSLDTSFASAGVYTSDPSAAPWEDAPYRMVHAGGVLFISGCAGTMPSGQQWRIEALFR
ncbi:MAG: hypothetical protein ACYTHN_22320 [Planctomycetota bacterium]|jgi:hypothetical protein